MCSAYIFSRVYKLAGTPRTRSRGTGLISVTAALLLVSPAVGIGAAEVADEQRRLAARGHDGRYFPMGRNRHSRRCGLQQAVAEVAALCRAQGCC